MTNRKDRMTNEDLEKFLVKYDIRNAEFADIVGVTEGAVTHWLSGRRKVPVPIARLIKLFELNPQLIRRVIQ